MQTSQTPNLAQYGKLVWYLVLAIVVGSIVVVLAPFATSLAWATVMSVLTYPLYSKLRGKFAETPSALLTMLSTFLLVGVPVALVGLLVFVQFKGVIDNFEKNPDGSRQSLSIDLVAKEFDKNIAPMVQSISPGFSATKYVQDDQNRRNITEKISGPVTRTATNLVVNTVLVVIAFLTMFFMLKDGHKLRGPFAELMPLPKEVTNHILDRVIKTLHAVFMGVILVAFVQGLVATGLYVVVGVEPWLMWGAATMILCAVPLLGAPVIYVPWALILFSQGKIWQGTTLLIIGFGIVSNIDNFLRPKYIGERVGLSYLPIFYSLLGGVLVMGPIGLFAGPVLLTVALELAQYLRGLRQQSADVPVPHA